MGEGGWGRGGEGRGGEGRGGTERMRPRGRSSRTRPVRADAGSRPRQRIFTSTDGKNSLPVKLRPQGKLGRARTSGRRPHSRIFTSADGKNHLRVKSRLRGKRGRARTSGRKGRPDGKFYPKTSVMTTLPQKSGYTSILESYHCEYE
jgi:hypothetical protein